MTLVDDIGESSNDYSYTTTEEKKKIRPKSDYGLDFTVFNTFDFALFMWFFQAVFVFAISISMSSFLPWYVAAVAFGFSVFMLYTSRSIHRREKKWIKPVIVISSIISVLMIVGQLIFVAVYNAIIALFFMTSNT